MPLINEPSTGNRNRKSLNRLKLLQGVHVCVHVCQGLGQPSEQERMEANKASLRAKAAYPDYLFNHL